MTKAEVVDACLPPAYLGRVGPLARLTLRQRRVRRVRAVPGAPRCTRRSCRRSSRGRALSHSCPRRPFERRRSERRLTVRARAQGRARTVPKGETPPGTRPSGTPAWREPDATAASAANLSTPTGRQPSLDRAIDHSPGRGHDAGSRRIRCSLNATDDWPSTLRRGFCSLERVSPRERVARGTHAAG